MQDQYTGDIGDFGKYGLLRSLTSPETGNPLRLGVVWYLTQGENHSPDGQQTGYLHLEERRRERFTACDEELYLALRELSRYGKPQRERRPRIRNPTQRKHSTTAKHWHSRTRKGAGERQPGKLNEKGGSRGTRPRWRQPRTATSYS